MILIDEEYPSTEGLSDSERLAQAKEQFPAKQGVKGLTGEQLKNFDKIARFDFAAEGRTTDKFSDVDIRSLIDVENAVAELSVKVGSEPWRRYAFLNATGAKALGNAELGETEEFKFAELEAAAAAARIWKWAKAAIYSIRESGERARRAAEKAARERDLAELKSYQ